MVRGFNIVARIITNVVPYSVSFEYLYCTGVPDLAILATKDFMVMARGLQSSRSPCCAAELSFVGGVQWGAGDGGVGFRFQRVELRVQTTAENTASIVPWNKVP